MTDAVVVGDHDLLFAADVKFADDFGVGAAQNVDQVAVGAAAGVDPENTHRDAVAVHGSMRGFFGDIDVAFDAFDGFIRNHEGVAIAMGAEASTDGWRFARFLTHAPLSW